MTRERFLGPAPLVNDGSSRPIPLPGYPTPLAVQPPQNAAIADGRLVVAGGEDGTVIDVPILSTGLGAPTRLLMPSIVVQGIHGPEVDVSRFGAVPIRFIAPLSADVVLAVTNGAKPGVAVGYAVDVGRHVVLGETPLGNADSVAAAEFNGTGAVLLGDGTLALVDVGLHVRRLATGLTGASHPWAMALHGDTAYIATGVFASQVDGAAAQLLAVSLLDGSTRLLQTGKTKVGGTVATDGKVIVWSHPDTGTLERFDLTTSALRIFPSCPSNSTVLWSGEVFLTCTGPGRLDVLNLTTGKVVEHPAGAFPVDFVVPPASLAG